MRDILARFVWSHFLLVRVVQFFLQKSLVNMMGVEDMPQMKSLSPGLPLSPPKKVQQVSAVSHRELFYLLRQRCQYQMICHVVSDKIVLGMLLWHKIMPDFSGKNSERKVLYI
jgi:hypothetical protein